MSFAGKDFKKHTGVVFLPQTPKSTPPSLILTPILSRASSTRGLWVFSLIKETTQQTPQRALTHSLSPASKPLLARFWQSLVSMNPAVSTQKPPPNSTPGLSLHWGQGAWRSSSSLASYALRGDKNQHRSINNTVHQPFQTSCLEQSQALEEFTGNPEDQMLMQQLRALSWI